MKALDGKVVIITGASRYGIGGATARKFASAGASLVLSSMESEADRTGITGDCRRLANPKATITCSSYDFTDGTAAGRMVTEALEACGRVDILVNNAVMWNYKKFGSYSEKEFDDLIAVNLKAPFFASQAVLPAMQRQGAGRIIHVASQMGIVTAPDLSVYSLTKASLISLARSMALELSDQGISVNAVSPGPIATAHLLEGLTDADDRSEEIARIPIGRFGTPEEVAEAIYFLATSEGDFIQGHNLVIDGGYVNQ